MSWNVLADAYIRPAYYPGVEPALLRPGARTAAIVAHLAASDADIACLQEAEPALLDELHRWEVHRARKIGKPDCCAIAARRRAAIDETRTLVYADGTGHVALIAIASLGGARVQLATTHLRWDRADTPSAERWSVREARELIDALDRTLPTIVCGDLNIEPTDEVYAMFLGAGLVDPCPDAPTANSNARAKRIDHVLHTPGLVARAAPCLPIDATTPLPSATMPSDHIPISVWFEL